MDAQDRARGVRLALFDVDGVLTDGRLWYGPQGEAFKTFHILDGHGLKMLAAAGIVTGLLSGRDSPAAAARARELGLAHVMLGVSDKLARFGALASSLGIPASACAFVGDDLPDLPVMRRCALGLTVPDAPQLVRAHAHHVTRRRGGEGAVREACELVMQAQGTLAAVLREYLA